MKRVKGYILLQKFYWGEKPICPYCKSINKKSNGPRFHCNYCNSNFTVTVGTIFHNTRCPLEKWLMAILIIMDNRWITCREMAKKIGVTKDTASTIIHRIRGNWDECSKINSMIKGPYSKIQ